MTPKTIFIVVPSLTATSPIRGAAALANALVERTTVTLVGLKPSKDCGIPLDPRVQVAALGDLDGWPARIRRLRSMLDAAGGRASAVLISMGFSADMVALRCRRSAVICCSVRGNLPRNYSIAYGPAGWLIAAVQLWLLRYFDHVVAMTQSMSRQIARFSGRSPVVIGNFVDEAALSAYRDRPMERDASRRVVFVGSLSTLKRPDLALRAIGELRRSGDPVKLDVVGNGPLTETLRRDVRAAGAESWVTLHGNLDDPYDIVARSDCLLLPSLTEGVSRAVLEALYLGVPCVVRNVDGADEIIRNGVNGYLFDRDEEISAIVGRALDLCPRTTAARPVLVPSQCRQKFAAERFRALLEGHVG